MAHENVPPLDSIPDKDSTLFEWVCSEVNGNFCAPPHAGADNCVGVRGPLTTHVAWVYKSVAALQEDDIAIFGGDFFYFDWANNNAYYKDGFLNGLVDAMNRGARIVLIIGRGYTGGAPTDTGAFNQCPGPQCCAELLKPGDPGYKSGLPKGMYGDWACCSTQQMLELLKNADPGRSPSNPNAGPRLLLYDLPNKNLVTSHAKIIAFYLKKSNRVSVFRGGWNMNTWACGNNMKETGIGILTSMDSPLGQVLLWKDSCFLGIFEHYYNLSLRISAVLRGWLNNATPPTTTTVTIPKLYFAGPNYCDPNFGCGADGPRAYDETCTTLETWVTGMDTNVTFTLGVSPPPGNDAFNYQWSTYGWPKDMPYGMSLLCKLINGAKKFVKGITHSQCLANPCCGATNANGTTTGPDGCMESQNVLSTCSNGNASVPAFETALRNLLLRGGNWFHMENANSGWTDPRNTSSFIHRLTTRPDPGAQGHVFPRAFVVCGNRGTMTHDKIWLTDSALLFSSGHPDILHNNLMLINDDSLIENAPNFLDYMHTHYNYMWGFTQYDPAYPSTQTLALCPRDVSGTTCCLDTTKVAIEPRRGFGQTRLSVPVTDKYYMCGDASAGACVLDTTGTCTESNPACFLNDATCKGSCGGGGGLKPNVFYTCSADNQCVQTTEECDVSKGNCYKNDTTCGGNTCNGTLCTTSKCARDKNVYKNAVIGTAVAVGVLAVALIVCVIFFHRTPR